MATQNTVGEIIDFFRGKGLSDTAIAGILGNMRVESDFNTHAYNPGEGAIGLGQWEGGRRTALQNYASAHGMTETDLQAQLGYYWHELTTSYSNVYQQLVAAPDASSAANVLNRQYEISGDYTNDRENYASQYLSNNFKDIAGTTVASSGDVPAGAGAQDGGVGGGSSAPTASDYKAQLGDLGKALSQIPELHQLLRKAIDGDWAVDKFTNAVDNSDWYKNHSATARSVIVQKLSDPATYQQSLNQAQQTIQSIASQNGWDLNQAQLQKIAQHALLTGNDSNTTWLEQAVGKRQHYGHLDDTGDLQGNMAATADQLQQYASEYGQAPSAHALAHAAKQVLMGNQTADTYRQQYLAQAKSMFPGLSTQLDSGQTVADIADPYVQSMSNLLEVDPNTLSVRTPMIRKALQGTQQVTDGKSTTPAVQPLWAFEQDVRSDPRWAYTDNAKAQTATVLTQLGQDWGFAS